MGKYRKKPVIIEAIRFFNGDGKNTIADCIAFTKDAAVYNNGSGMLIISTLEGDHAATDGDFIIQGVKGEFYPCKPDIFEATYEKVED